MKKKSFGRFISVNPKICHGKLCFRGTRILVSDVLVRVSGYKQGRTMQVIAGATVIVSILSSNVFLVVRVLGLDHLTEAIRSGLAPQAVASSILGILIGIYAAIQRLR